MALCDHVTVLKDGTAPPTSRSSGIDAAGLVRLMVGRDPGDLFPRWQPVRRRATPSSRDAQLRGRQMQGVDLAIAAGEVLGIGGLVGQGQEDLLLGLYGAIPASSDHCQSSEAGRACRRRVAGANGSASPMCRPIASARACTSPIRSPPI